MSAAYQPKFEQEGASAAMSFETSTSGAGAATSQVWPASAGTSHVLGGIFWSYNTTPTNGKLTIADGATTVFEIDIPTAGAGFIPFLPPRIYTAGNTLTITLAGGGGSVVGKLNVNHWWQNETAGVTGVTTTTTTTTTTSTTTTT